MRSIMVKSIVLVVGLVLFALLLVPVTSSPVSARPLLAITETPQEPAPPTSPPPTSPPTSPPVAPTSPPVEPTSPPKHNEPDTGTPDVSIIKTVDQSSAKRGDLIGFTLHVNNEGTATAKDVVVIDNVPSYLTIQDYSVSKGTISVSGNTITANIGTLSTGEYVTVRFRAYLSADAPEKGSNTATVTDSNGDSNPNNNSSTVSFGVEAPPPSPTSVPSTQVPAPPAPTAQPPVRVPRQAQRPASLPKTGNGDDQTAMLTALALIGLSGLGIGWTVRRRAQR